MSNENKKDSNITFIFIESCKINKNDQDKPTSHDTEMVIKELNKYPGSFHISQKKKEFFYEIYKKWIFDLEMDHI